MSTRNLYKYVLLVFAGTCVLPPGLVLADAWVGKAYDSESGELRYQEVHRTASHLAGTLLSIDYLTADGRPLGSKQVDFSASAWLPEFTTRVPSLDFEEGVKRDSGMLLVRYRAAGDAPMQERLPDTPGESPRVADAGFDRFIRDRWLALLDGNIQPLEFLVPSMGRFVSMRVRHVGSVEDRGLAAERFVLEPDSWMLRLVVAPIACNFTREERALLRYTGISNLPAENGGNLTVDIRFSAAESSIASVRVAP